MVPPPEDNDISSDPTVKHTPVGPYTLEVRVYWCPYHFMSKGAFCYRLESLHEYAGYVDPDIDPILGVLAPYGVKAGGIGCFPTLSIASRMGTEMLKTWKELYGEDFLAQAITCFLHRHRLGEGKASGL
jgi:hypothetical protein